MGAPLSRADITKVMDTVAEQYLRDRILSPRELMTATGGREKSRSNTANTPARRYPTAMDSGRALDSPSRTTSWADPDRRQATKSNR